jgi:hypothetical protein
MFNLVHIFAMIYVLDLIMPLIWKLSNSLTMVLLDLPSRMDIWIGCSQYGDIQTKIDGRDQTAALFVTEYFGFHRDRLWVVALVHIVFTVAFALMFSFAS